MIKNFIIVFILYIKSILMYFYCYYKIFKDEKRSAIVLYVKILIYFVTQFTLHRLAPIAIFLSQAQIIAKMGQPIKIFYILLQARLGIV